MSTTARLAAEQSGARTSQGFAAHQRVVFGTLLVGYMGYYLCRQNLSVAFTPLSHALGIDKAALGLISTVGTLLYAAGKLTTGAIADARGGRLVFLVGLWGSVFASVLFGLGSGAAFFALAWGLNRLFQSMGWVGLVKVLARWFPRANYGTAMGLMTVSYQLGGAVATVFAGALLGFGLGWRALFFVPAAVLAVVGLAAHRLLHDSPEDVGHALPHEPDPEEAVPAVLPARAGGAPGSSSAPASGAATTDAAEDPRGYLAQFRAVLSQPAFLVMCGLSLVLTLEREIFGLWMPAYFADMGAAASTAAFKSAVFPLLGCTGTLAAGYISDRFLGGRRVPVIIVSLVALSLALLGLGQLTQLAAFAQAHLGAALNRDVLAVALVGVAGFFLLAPYSMVGGGVIALDFGGRKTAATAAGLLDGTGYLAASLAGAPVAELVVHRGWPLAYSLMAALTMLGALACAALLRWAPERRT
jgi:sugar phosphate permease